MTELDQDGSGCCGCITILIIISLAWGFAQGIMDDDPSGACRGELGYMGQVEYVECGP